MDFNIITDDQWDSFPPNLNRTEAEAVKTIEWAWERWHRGGLPNHQRRYLADVLKREAKKIKTEDARRYLDRRYNMRYGKQTLLSNRETCDK